MCNCSSYDFSVLECCSGAVTFFGGLFGLVQGVLGGGGGDVGSILPRVLLRRMRLRRLQDGGVGN